MIDFIRRVFGLPVVTPRAAHPDDEEDSTSPLWGWNKERIQAAAMALDEGDFASAEDLYEGMTRLGRISSALERRAEGVRNFPFSLELRDGTPETIQFHAEQLEELWDEYVLSEIDRSEVISRVVWFGFCVCRIHKPLIDGQRVPHLVPWTHRTLKWQPIENGWTAQDCDGKQLFIPRNGDDEWAVFSRGGQRPWLKGVGRQLARIFAQILQTEDLWDSSNKEVGYALKVLTVPSNLREQSEVEQAWAVVRKLRAGDTWLTPEGYKLDLLESKRGNAHENFKARLDVLAATISITILGHNLTQETKSGSLAATSAAMEVPREASITDATILKVGYRPLVRLWLRLNFNPDFYRTERPLSWYVPCPEFDTEPPADEAAEAETGHKNAMALDVFVTCAVKARVDIPTLGIDWRKAAEECHVALIELPDGKEARPVVYLEAVPTPPAEAPQKKLLSAREPETEGERLGADFWPASGSSIN